jgi:hypothetical protein
MAYLIRYLGTYLLIEDRSRSESLIKAAAGWIQTSTAHNEVYETTTTTK